VKKSVLKRKVLYYLSIFVLTSPTVGFAEELGQDALFDEIVVTANRTETPKQEVTSTVSVITREMIDNSPATSVQELLGTVPGVALYGYGGLGNKTAVSIRGLDGGGSSQKMLLLIDGRPANYAFQGGIDWNTLPLANIESIEVVRGPVSTMYGDNSLGGAVNIITRKYDKDMTSLETSYGSFQTFTTSLVQQGKMYKGNYVITGNYGKTNGFRDHTDYEGNNFTIRMNFDNGLTFAGGYTNYDRTNPGTAGIPKDANNKDYENWQYDRAEGYHFDLSKEIKSGVHTTKISTYYNVLDSSNIREKTANAAGSGGGNGSGSGGGNGSGSGSGSGGGNGSGSGGGNGSGSGGGNGSGSGGGNGSGSNSKVFTGIWELNNDIKERTFGIQLNQNIALSDKHAVNWGIDYRFMGADVYEIKSNPQQGDFSANESALYVLDSRKLGDKLTMDIGGRYDHHSDYGGQFNPKFGLAYAADRDITVRLNIARAFKAPTLNDLYGDNGNPDLRPTRSWNYELGVEKRFDENTRGSLTFYRAEVKDLIVGKSRSGQDKKINLDDMQPQGVELELARKIDKHVDVFANYTYLDVGDMTRRASRHKGNIGVNYKNGAFKASLYEQYVGTSYEEDLRAYPDAEKVGAYALTSLKLAYEPEKSGYVYTFAVLNLFDQDYESYLNHPMPGRAYTFSVKKLF